MRHRPTVVGVADRADVSIASVSRGAQRQAGPAGRGRVHDQPPLRGSPELVDALVNATVPEVIVGDIAESTPLDTVRTDSRRGVVMAHAHLLETGRRRIAFVNGPSDKALGRAGREGYQQACAATGSMGPVVEVDDFTVGAGEEAWATHGALDPRRRPDAVIAGSDLLAFGVMRAAQNARRRVPRQLAVVGIDDTQLARVFSPSLTSVSLGARRRGHEAARLLLARMGAPRTPPHTVRVEPRLVVRESSAPARERVGS